MRIQSHTSFADYVKLVASRSVREPILYRGQRDSRWKLENRWKRFQRDYLAVGHDGRAVRDALQERMKREFHLVELGRDPMSEAELEALSQHNGLPTRLMDWSYSPYVALFFAYDAASVASNSAAECAVYEIDIGKFMFAACFMIERNDATASSPVAKTYAFTKNINVLTPSILEIEDRFNRRSNRQDGAFIILPDKYGHLEEFEAECIATHAAAEFITKHVLPNNERIHAVRQLQDMGNRASSVFCDPSYSTVDAAFRTLASLS